MKLNQHKDGETRRLDVPCPTIYRLTDLGRNVLEVLELADDEAMVEMFRPDEAQWIWCTRKTLVRAKKRALYRQKGVKSHPDMLVEMERFTGKLPSNMLKRKLGDALFLSPISSPKRICHGSPAIPPLNLDCSRENSIEFIGTSCSKTTSNLKEIQLRTRTDSPVSPITCPYCFVDFPADYTPSQRLESIRKAIETTTYDRPFQYATAQQVFCKGHELETTLMPRAVEAGWPMPQDINLGGLNERVQRLALEFRTDLLPSLTNNNFFSSVSKRESSRSKNPWTRFQELYRHNPG
jgi:hypothetical protein